MPARAVLLWLAGALVTIWMVAMHWANPGTLFGRDFVNQWLAGTLVLQGNVGAIFDADAFRAAADRIVGEKITVYFGYPPHSLFLAVPFALLPYPFSLFLWTVAGAAFFLWAARDHCPRAMPLVLAILTPAALANISFGQNGFIIGGLWLLAFSGRGWAAAAATIKPHLGLMIAVQMLRDRKALLVAIGGTIALVIASVLAFGPDSWRAFLTEILTFQSEVIAPENRQNMMRRMVTPEVAYGPWAHLLFAAAAMILLWRNFNVFTAATATFLIVPYAFHYDMTVANLGFAVLIFTRWNEMAAWHRIVACLAFLAPELVSFGWPIVPPILLLGLYVQTLWTDRREKEPASEAAPKVGQPIP